MTENILLNLVWILVFPGFAFTLFVGVIVSWIVRKVSALVQWRVGPAFIAEGRVFQGMYDILKLLGKEILIPKDSQKFIFVAAPLFGFAGVLLLATMLSVTCLGGQGYLGDIIGAMYLMVIPSLALILGSSASGSSHAALGAAREMKLVLSYELALVLSIIVVIIKTGGAVDLAVIAGFERMPVASISGVIAFLVSVFCVQAKLGFVPFDIAEAETELGSGVLMEYSGPLLAMWKIMQAMMLVALPLFLVMVFLGGFGSGFWGLIAGVLKYVFIVVLLILIKNTNPRVRIDQAMKFFWVYCGLALVIAVVIAMAGVYFGIDWL